MTLRAPAVQEEASKRKRRGQKLFALQAKTTFGHRKSDKRERIRNPLLKEKRIAAVALLPRNDGGVDNGLPRTLRRSRLPARSVLLLRRGVHRTPAPQRQDYTKRLFVLFFYSIHICRWVVIVFTFYFKRFCYYILKIPRAVNKYHFVPDFFGYIPYKFISFNSVFRIVRTIV